MTNEEARDVLRAIRCCRADNCQDCPLQPEICDEFWVDTETVPAELLDKAEEAIDTLTGLE